MIIRGTQPNEDTSVGKKFLWKGSLACELISNDGKVECISKNEEVVLS